MSGREEKLFYALQRLSEPFIEAYGNDGDVEELHSKPLTHAEAFEIVRDLVDPEHLSEHDLKEMIRLSVAHFSEGTELPYCANVHGDFKVKYRSSSLKRASTGRGRHVEHVSKSVTSMRQIFFIL